MLLRRGSRGMQVVSLQRQLQYLGYDIGRWGADGDFGPATLQAVLAFQKNNNLVVDGLVGPATRAALFVAKQLPTGSPNTTQPAPIPPDPHIPSQASPIVKPSNHFYQHNTNCFVTEVNPMHLKISEETDRPGYAFTDDNLLTAAFLGHHPDKRTYPTSMLVSEGIVLSNRQPNGYHRQDDFAGKGFPTPTFMVLRNGSVQVDVLNDIRQYRDVWFAVSGLGIIPRTDYGFPGSYAGSVGYKTFRVGLGYHPGKNRVLMVYHKAANTATFVKTLKALGCTMGISTDSGGSAVFKVNGKFIRSTTRRLPAMITWT